MDLRNYQHDPPACAVALGWDGVTREPVRIATEVRTAWLHERVDVAGRPVSVVTAVDGARFNDFRLDAVPS